MLFEDRPGSGKFRLRIVLVSALMHCCLLECDIIHKVCHKKCAIQLHCDIPYPWKQSGVGGTIDYNTWLVQQIIIAGAVPHDYIGVVGSINNIAM